MTRILSVPGTTSMRVDAAALLIWRLAVLPAADGFTVDLRTG